MRYLEIAKNDLNLNEEQIDKVKDDLIRIRGIVEKNKLNIVDTFEISFVNHVIACIERIENNEKVDGMDEEMLSELSEKALSISTEILGEIYERKNANLDKAEVCLLATHIEVALNI